MEMERILDARLVLNRVHDNWTPELAWMRQKLMERLPNGWKAENV